MTTVEDRLVRLTLAAIPLVIVAVGCSVRLLPRHLVMDALTFMTIWLSFSLPIGVLVGHCALGEGEYH